MEAEKYRTKRYRVDAEYREKRKAEARQQYATHKEEIKRRVYLRLVEIGRIKTPRKLEHYNKTLKTISE